MIDFDPSRGNEYEGATIVDRVRYWALNTPDNPALLGVAVKPLDYKGLAALCEKLGSTLNAAGVGQGDRVAIIHSGGPDAAAAIIGIWSHATAVPLNIKYTLGEFAIHLRDIGIKAIAVEKDLDTPARQAAAQIGLPVFEIVNGDTLIAGNIELKTESIVKHAPTSSLRVPEPNDEMVVLTTSGTTSHSKIVPILQRHMLARGRQIARALKFVSGDRGANFMPLYHVGGVSVGLSAALYSGSSLLPLKTDDIECFFDHLEMIAPTYVAASHTAFHSIAKMALHFENNVLHARTGIRMLRAGAGRLEIPIVDDLEKIFDAPVIQAYGSTETGFIACNPLPPTARNAENVGLSCGCEIEIQQSDGTPSAPGITGEIVVRGENIIDGYDGDPAANLAAFRDGWYHTGDEGRFDDDGSLFLTGRIKEVIRRGGQSISPVEIERALLDHPDIIDAVVFAIPHPTLGEDLSAVVVPKEGTAASKFDLMNFLATRVSSFKIPQEITFVEAIPTGATDKVQRRNLAVALGLTNTTKNALAKSDKEEGPVSTLEATLANIWARALGLDKVGRHENFFTLGGDSLQAVQMFLNIEKQIGQQLPRSILFEAGSVAELALRIESGTPPSCLVAIQTKGKRPPVFAIHPIGGTVICYRDLSLLIGSQQPFYGVQCIGPEGKEGYFTSLENMAENYLREIRKYQPTGPYYLTGHSFGGLVAYEIAQQLQAAGQTVALLAILDSGHCFSPTHVKVSQWVLRNFYRFIHADHRGRWALVRSGITKRYGQALGIFSSVDQDASIDADPMPKFGIIHHGSEKLVAANKLLSHAYKPAPYAGDAVLFQSQRPHEERLAIRKSWARIIKGNMEIRDVSGNHVALLHKPFVETLARQLAEILEERQAHAAIYHPP